LHRASKHREQNTDIGKKLNILKLNNIIQEYAEYWKQVLEKVDKEGLQFYPIGKRSKRRSSAIYSDQTQNEIEEFQWHREQGDEQL
jgi:hypothetical protein